MVCKITNCNVASDSFAGLHFFCEYQKCHKDNIFRNIYCCQKYSLQRSVVEKYGKFYKEPLTNLIFSNSWLNSQTQYHTDKEDPGTKISLNCECIWLWISFHWIIISKSMNMHVYTTLKCLHFLHTCSLSVEYEREIYLFATFWWHKTGAVKSDVRFCSCLKVSGCSREWRLDPDPKRFTPGSSHVPVRLQAPRHLHTKMCNQRG